MKLSALVVLGSPSAFVEGLINAPQDPPKSSASVSVSASSPPGPFKWPIVGTLPDFFSRGGVDGMSAVHESMYRDYGPIYGMSLMGEDELVVSDPRVFETSVLRNEGRFPIGNAEFVTTFVDYYRANDLNTALKGTARGSDWKEWRRALNPDLYVLWDAYLPAIAEAAAAASRAAGEQVNGGRVRLDEFLSRLAFDMFSAVLYGKSPGTADGARADPEDLDFVRSTQKAFDITGALMTDPLQKLLPGGLPQQFAESMDRTFGFATARTAEFVEEARRCPVSNLAGRSFVRRLVDRDVLSDEEISEVVGPLLMAGVDTTAYVMSWLYLNLAANPAAQSALARELRAVLDGEDLVSSAQLDALPYLRACVRESHRLTPGGPLLVKKLPEDVRVAVEGREYLLEADRRISLNLRGVPMDPRYVERPREYRPERFLPEAIAARRGTPAEIVDHPLFEDPFGGGKRKCVGGNVAYAEIYCSAARLFQDWEISLKSDDVRWKPKQKLMQKADPYPEMVLSPRKSS